MLFALPTPASGPTRAAAPTAAIAPVSGLGVFPPRPGVFGTALRAVVRTVVRSGLHGWFPERRPSAFQAERRERIGTVLFSPINPRPRILFHGWFGMRGAASDFDNGPHAALGTAPGGGHRTVARSGLHGWFPGRRPEHFQAERREPIGTALLSPINPRPRILFHGWFGVRGAASDFNNGPHAALGTAPGGGHRTVARSGFHGWFAERRPGLSGTGGGYHVPVLAGETVGWMAAGPGSYIIDGTLGGGGHSERFLEAGARVLGIDRDPEALAHARERLARFGDRFETWEGDFADFFRDHPEVRGGERADGLLLDLGVSSRQLDSAVRGFSFQKDGPLDMRMGPSVGRTAAEIVNDWPEDELIRIFREYGEEPRARRIASAIIRRRADRHFETTLDLAGCIEREIGRRGRTHPATRAFQAIRIAVNDELGSLGRALEHAAGLLKPGGRLLVITFHSLEDRMVKQFMHDRSSPWLDRPEWPGPRPNPRWAFRLPQRKAIAPGDTEIRINPRARSAKLRVAELLDPDICRP